ncbi:hypothetical protein NIES2130_18945 [Scytonema sp. HK-05]|nr:hypothetical protein NIES2130_18945 [Scytonema sp. HK-05]
MPREKENPLEPQRVFFLGKQVKEFYIQLFLCSKHLLQKHSQLLMQLFYKPMQLVIRPKPLSDGNVETLHATSLHMLNCYQQFLTEPYYFINKEFRSEKSESSLAILYDW